jgi:hypothetical protein
MNPAVSRAAEPNAIDILQSHVGSLFGPGALAQASVTDGCGTATP